MLTKIHSGRLASIPKKEGIFAYLNNTSDFVLVERDDLLDVVMSLTLAHQTDQWNNLGKLRYEYTPFTVEKKRISEVLGWKREYDFYKEKITNVLGVVKYENIGSSHHTDMLRHLGFNDEEILSKVGMRRLPVKLITKERKLELLENYSEVMEWFEEYK